MPSYGIGFQPGGEQQQGNGEQKGPAPLESVVKLLNLRLPSVVGARGIAPQGLLNSPGMAGLAGGMGEQQWLQILQRLLGGGQGMQGGMAPQTTPRVIPGVDNPPNDRPQPIDLESILRGRTGGNTGIGNTGRPQGPLGPAPQTAPPQDFNPPQGMPSPYDPPQGLFERQ